MKSIYASKLYMTSNRKDRIHAALIAPGNLALVQQLADDLDEEFQVPENLGAQPKEETSESKEDKEATEDEFSEFKVDEDINPKTDLVTMNDFKSPSPSPNKRSSSSDKNEDEGSSKEDTSESKESKADTSDLIPESPANEQKPSESTEASTKVASATLADLTLLKNTLNSREDTAGVIRIAEKEKELWIYYNDDINLNNIMTNVIEYLIDNNYEQYEFNRLARSDNAIVFVRDKSTESNLESIDSTTSVE